MRSSVTSKKLTLVVLASTVTLKLSYSCMGNINAIISIHNKAVISKSTRTNNQTKKSFNCRKPNECPMDGNCNVESVIYQAEVTTETAKETYIGLCDTGSNCVIETM